MVCNNVRIVYMCMHVGVNKYAANRYCSLACAYNELDKHSHSVWWHQYQNHVQLNTCIHTYILFASIDWPRCFEGSMKTVFIFHHSLVHTYTAVRLAELLVENPLHTYIHKYMLHHINAPHSNRRHESYRPCDGRSSSSSSSSMEKWGTATPEMIQSMKAARWESKLNSMNTVRWMNAHPLRVCVPSYGDRNLQWTVQGKQRKKGRLYLHISSYS